MQNFQEGSSGSRQEPHGCIDWSAPQDGQNRTTRPPGSEARQKEHEPAA
jgi:hypothetical protein